MPDPATRPSAGLVSAKGNAPIPLEGVSVEATIRDFCSRVTVSQRFRNTEAQPIEAVYVFPLDEGAAVCGFEALIGGTRVVGRVEEKEKAFAHYDDALAAGHGAYLLDQERPDVFTASIGNLRPGDEVLVRVTYVAELQREGEAIRFVVPTTVSPRYAPAEDEKGVGRTPALALNPPLAWTVPYGLELRAVVEMASAIRSLESPSHPVSVEIDGGRATVCLAAREAALDRDFVLKIGLAEAHAPRTYLETTPAGETVALLAFEPRFAAGETAGEIVFVVDRSGSMQGSSIAEARNALQLCLRSLRAGWFFNVVGFGSTCRRLFEDNEPYDEKTLAEATRHLAGLEADLGGTEILPALEGILKRPPRPGLPRQVFILTDGQVTNTEAVIALVRKHSGDTRVFTFGIGAGASAHLVRGIARAGEGEAEFIHPGERIEAKVMRQLKRAMAPALTDVEVDWGGLEVRPAPHRLPPVFDGGRVLVYGFLETAAAATVTLRARGPEGSVSFVAQVDPGQARPDSLLATLAARTLIRELEDGQSPQHDRRGSLQDREGGKDRVKAEIVRLGVTYGLCSRETSFVAVEQRDTPGEDDAVLRRVPVALTSGWGGTPDRAVPGMGGMGIVMGRGPVGSRDAIGASPRVLRASRDVFFSAGVADETSIEREAGIEMQATFERAPAAAPAPRLSVPAPESLGRSMRKLFREWLGWAPAVPPANVAQTAPEGAAPRPTVAGARPFDHLVALQRADGSWALDEDLARLVGRPLGELERHLSAATGDAAEARRALATALALVWLQRHSALQQEWEMLADKAAAWLAACAARLGGGKEWLKFAQSILVRDEGPIAGLERAQARE